MSTVRMRARWQFARALRNRPFTLLWLGQSISIAGNAAFTTALAWQVLLLTGSATAMGLVVVAQSLPQMILLALGGVMADRWSRRSLMLWSDTARGVAVMLVATLSALHVIQVWHLVILSILFGVVRSFFDPAYLAIMPSMVDHEELASANALTGVSQQIGRLCGPVVGALLVVIANPSGAFAFDGLTFAISAFCLLLIRLPLPALTATQAPVGAGSAEPGSSGAFGGAKGSRPISARPATRPSILKEIGAGATYVSGVTWLWVSIAVSAALNMAVGGPLAVALPKLVADVYGAGVWLLGLISAASAVGALVATVTIGHWSRIPRPGILAFGAALLASLGLAALGWPLTPSQAPFVACLASGAVGFGLAAANLIWVTLMQQQIPRHFLGRVSSLDLLGSFCLVPLGYLLAGRFADQVGPALVFIGGGLLSALLATLAMTLPDVRKLR